jgi:hypothetical protein
MQNRIHASIFNVACTVNKRQHILLPVLMVSQTTSSRLLIPTPTFILREKLAL